MRPRPRPLNGMAQLSMQQGEYSRALEREEEALRLRLALGDQDAVAHSEETIGAIYSRLGEYDHQHCGTATDRWTSAAIPVPACWPPTR